MFVLQFAVLYTGTVEKTVKQPSSRGSSQGRAFSLLLSGDFAALPLHLSIVGYLAGTKDLLAIVSSHTQALKAIAAAKSAISCKNRILSVRTTDFELLPCGSKATELLQILVATIIDHCPSVYANKLKIARGIFPNGLAIIDDS